MATITRTDVLTVDISNTVGQSSAIEANGGPVFTIEVEYHPEVFLNGRTGEFDYEMLGFGTVISGGPVNGYQIGFLAASIVEAA